MSDNYSIFLIYLHSLHIGIHSVKQLVLLYQVYSNWYLYNELIFLIYLYSLQVMNHSEKQLVSLYQVYSNWCLYNELIFLIFLHSLQVIIHSVQHLVWLYQVLIIISIFQQMFHLQMGIFIMVLTPLSHFVAPVSSTIQVLFSFFQLSLVSINLKNQISYYLSG